MKITTFASVGFILSLDIRYLYLDSAEEIENEEVDEIIPSKKRAFSGEVEDFGTPKQLDLRFGKKLKYFQEELEKDPSIVNGFLSIFYVQLLLNFT